MNNEIAPVLDILEELKQECKSISKAQAELRTTLAEQPANSTAMRSTTQETVQIHLSKETQAKIKEHQLFVLEALSQSSKKLDPKFEALQQFIIEQQKPVEYKNYSLSLWQRAISRTYATWIGLRAGHGELLVLCNGSQSTANSFRLRPPLPLPAYARQSHKQRLRPSRQPLYHAP